MEQVLRNDLTRAMTEAEITHFGPDQVTEPELLTTIAELSSALARLLAMIHFENADEEPFTHEEVRALWRGRRALAMRAPTLLPTRTGEEDDPAITFERLDQWIRNNIHETDEAHGTVFVG